MKLHSAAATSGIDVSKRLSVAQVVFAAHVPDYRVSTLANGNRLVQGLRIFRSGTFKDSVGDQHTWTDEHLSQMVANFDMLRANGLLVDVPVRRDHSRSVDNIVGYIVALRVEGSFLLADIEFTDTDGWAKFESGTFRARSSEIGFYETNDEALFWPVVMGLAFVDIGAVEGLYARSDDNQFSLLSDTKESPVDEAQFLAACAYAQALIDLGLTDVVSRADHEAAVTAARAEAAANHGAATPAVFQVFGAATSDHAAVQTHITALETTIAEQRDAARKDFVAGLVKGNKLAATMEEAIADLAVGMTDEQYAAFSKSYEGAPVMPLLAKFGAGVTNPDGDDAQADAALDDQIAVARETVAMHRRSGMDDEQIRNTESFKTLTRLEAQKAGTAA